MSDVDPKKLGKILILKDQSEMRILEKSVLWVYSIFLDEGMTTPFFWKKPGKAEVFGTDILGKSRPASQDH